MHTPYCSECGRKIMIQINPRRNRGSGDHPLHRPHKDHDLCRQCFKSLMYRVRGQQDNDDAATT